MRGLIKLIPHGVRCIKSVILYKDCIYFYIYILFAVTLGCFGADRLECHIFENMKKILFWKKWIIASGVKVPGAQDGPGWTRTGKTLEICWASEDGTWTSIIGVKLLLKNKYLKRNHLTKFQVTSHLKRSRGPIHVYLFGN